MEDRADMLGVLTSDLLDRLAREDAIANSDTDLDGSWRTYDDLPTAVNAVVAPGRVAFAAIASVAALGLLALFLTAGLAQSSSLSNTAKMLLPAIALMVPFFALYLARAIPSVIDRRLASEAAARSFSVYFEGASPFSGKRVLVGRHFMFLLSKAGNISRIPLSEVSTVGVDIRQSGALAVVVIEDRFLPLSLVGRVGGPMPSRWSIEGLFGIGKFKSVLVVDLERNGVPFAVTDWSGRE